MIVMVDYDAGDPGSVVNDISKTGCRRSLTCNPKDMLGTQND